MATVPDSGDWLRVIGHDLVLSVRVQPRASRTRVDGIESGRLQLRVTAPPVEGGANRAVVELLAAVLDLARGRISILRGEHARNKDVCIAGAAAARERFAETLVETCARKP
ncbi:MAG: DUF167 domain-containing protein [Gammaproteobacteria bacterium]|nr:DUF167 domain-containing protein [Gammaproteobacteria bacterium]